MTLKLLWHPYKYYPYEFELAQREIEALLSPRATEKTKAGILLSEPMRTEYAKRLVYFAATGDDQAPTIQAQLERVNGNGPNRQSTRYSAHGLHEYKGKFNPQIPKAILNMHAIQRGSRVLDPFCGSGTSLVEAVHLGMRASGTDVNPLAVFLANAKLSSLQIAPEALRDSILRLPTQHEEVKEGSETRRAYLESWFPREILSEIEGLRTALEGLESGISRILLACASDLLRAYSLQDPMDLRIRRRKSPLPEKPFRQAFLETVERFTFRLENARDALGEIGSGSAYLADSRSLTKNAEIGGPFDCVMTSPPYATALPYIDTQRLSLVWLGLIEPSEILPLESRLVGSRETRGAQKRELASALQTNAEGLPETQASYCLELLHSIGETDGFRRQAVPTLLYRYFTGMAESFRGVRSVTRDGAPYVLVVGGNHTVLGGKRFDINTPVHLAELAEANGWRTREILPLQTYQRYGYHMSNAVATEAMVILEAS